MMMISMQWDIDHDSVLGDFEMMIFGGYINLVVITWLAEGLGFFLKDDERHDGDDDIEETSSRMGRMRRKISMTMMNH